MEETLVNLEHVRKYFTVGKSFLKRNRASVKAIDDVSLQIRSGETLGLVGESGSGKTTLSKIILGLLPPDSGKILIGGNPLYAGEKTVRSAAGAVFQDPASSLNPRATVYESLNRPLIVNGCSTDEARKLILEFTEKVNIGQEVLSRFPYELSGGQQQRVSIARAIMLHPKLIVLDEPTSALDVSVQAQILNVLLDLQQEFGLTYLFITHNLSVVRYMSDRICVMYGGKIMEVGETEEIYSSYRNPYTMSLLSSMPPLHPKDRSRKKYLLSGDVPSLINVGVGCRFCARCRFAKERCGQEPPELRDIGGGHLVACHYAGSEELHL
jgi:oligopeptide/dipeptide ABC transporter, ATP-binding protein, C-terminal domain